MRVAAETAASRQFVVAEPFSAKVPDSHAAAKVEEGIVRTDAHSAGVLVTPLGQQFCWQMGENMLSTSLRISSGSVSASFRTWLPPDAKNESTTL